MQADVAVIGTGAMGSGALWRLAARGASVMAFEQFEPGHDQGSSHGETRIIRTAYYEGPQYVPLVRHAFAFWRRLERESGASLLTMSGALMMGRPDNELVAGSLASAREHGLAHEVLDAAELSRRYPQYHIAPDEVAFYEEAAGILRPEEAVRTMVRQAEGLGATVLRRTPVEALQADGDGVVIRAGTETHRVRRAVVAVGPWLPAFVPDWNIRLEVERQVFAWFPLRDPALFTPDRCPVFMHEISPGRFRYGIPSLHDATIKSGIHHEGVVTTPDAVDREVHPRDLAPVQDYIRHHLPAVDPLAARTKVCMYTNTPDHHFLIGSPPGLPAVTVLSVCSGHGFKYAPVVGDAVADLVLEGTTAYPIDLFTPERFAAGAGRGG